MTTLVRYTLPTLILLFGIHVSEAQSSRIFQATLPNNQKYTVSLSAVTSISLQKYISRTLAVQDGNTYMPLLSAAQGNQKPMFIYVDVTECTIETMGGIPARFYYVVPRMGPETEITVLGTDVTAEMEKKKEQLESIQQSIVNVATSNSDSNKGKRVPLVVKDYPLTTHARNLEFRLGSDGEVRSLYNTAFSQWTGSPSPTPSPAGSASPQSTP